MVSLIGLWGRSMGAVTSILQSSRDPSIAGMVLDSPFSNLNRLSLELAKTHTKIPQFIAKIV
jgi:alpha-beta hydrolase superfamily lysophospholipase